MGKEAETIEKILERKKAIKPLKMVYHSELLDADIEIKKVNPDKITALISERETAGQTQTYLKLIYECCPLFHAKELHAEYKPTEPFDIVDIILESNLKEIFELGNQILAIYGFYPRAEFETIKK